MISDYAFRSCTARRRVYFLGNAPVMSGYFTFLDVHPTATIHYLQGTSGWGANTAYGRLPIAMWMLPILSARTDPTNSFCLEIAGPAELPVVVESCTNLAQGNWTVVDSLRLEANSAYSEPPPGLNVPSRYYRVRVQ